MGTWNESAHARSVSSSPHVRAMAISRVYVSNSRCPSKKIP
jgi:hypothetical protein